MDPFPPNPPYYYQGTLANFFNKIYHSKAYRTLNPLRRHYEYHPEFLQAAARYHGVVPQVTWRYQSIDYSLAKEIDMPLHEHRQWNPLDKKTTPDGSKDHGYIFDKGNLFPAYPVYVSFPVVRGCAKEIDKFTKCSETKGQENCFKERINVMEICPQFELEKFRELRKFLLRAEAIDNTTYRRAMEVSEYNKGRTVSDIRYHNAEKLRPDSYYYDDRYDIDKMSHPHRDDAINFPEHKGGTKKREGMLREKYTKDVFTHVSQKDKERKAENHLK